MFYNIAVRYQICRHSKDVNEYLNRYSNIRMGIRIILEYSKVND